MEIRQKLKIVKSINLVCKVFIIVGTIVLFFVPLIFKLFIGLAIFSLCNLLLKVLPDMIKGLEENIMIDTLYPINK